MKKLPIIAVIVMLVSVNIAVCVGTPPSQSQLAGMHVGSTVWATDTEGTHWRYEKTAPDMWKLTGRMNAGDTRTTKLDGNEFTSSALAGRFSSETQWSSWDMQPAAPPAAAAPAPELTEPGAPPVAETPPQMEDMAGMETGSRIWATDSSGTKWEYTRVEGDQWQLTGKQLPGEDPQGISGGYKYTSPELAGRFSSETQWTSWQAEPAAQRAVAPETYAPKPSGEEAAPAGAAPAEMPPQQPVPGGYYIGDVGDTQAVYDYNTQDVVLYRGGVPVTPQEKTMIYNDPDLAGQIEGVEETARVIREQEGAAEPTTPAAAKPEEPKPEAPAPAPAPAAGTVTPSTQSVTEYTLTNTFLGNVNVQLTLGGDRVYRDSNGNVITSEEDINALDQMYSSEHEKYSPAYLGIFVQQYRQYAGLAGWSSLIFDEEFLNKWSTSVNQFFCDTIVLGGIDCWASKICGMYSEITPSRDGVLYTGGLGAPPRAIAHIEGQRSMPIITPNATYWGYTVTFGLTNPSTEEDMTYNILFGGDQTVAWWDTSQVLPGEMSASAVGASALYKVSMHNYGQVCIVFDPSMTDFEGNEKDKVCNGIVQYAGGATTPYTTTNQTAAAGTAGAQAQTTGPGANV